MHDYEKLGAFYLGKTYDLEKKATRDELLLYDSKDLTTHAICVGMTGSGKTGLCLSLLEEAAIDGIPAIIVDPKGDLGNLMLTFPELKATDFRPWIDESAAVRKAMTADQFAELVAKSWRDGLAQWGQPPERIQRFRDAADIAIYTPGSNAGLPLTVLRSFAAPSPQVIEDADLFRDRISSAASGLLALLGIDADPVRSREHILISNILMHEWKAGRNLDIARLIGEIQTPPFEKVGIMDLESFFPGKDRTELAMSLNNILASPSFASWMEGEPLDVKRLLYTNEGRPRLSILSIAHLSESERMFFVTILLNEVLTWIRSQAGTSSLRALLYMDEVYGYFPPTSNPPSKRPMLTLLKQARAYGLGVVLATQNPADLDYKSLSNAGTWFLGRLQAERDKIRVLEGLEGASIQAGSNFDRQKMEATLAGLTGRVFLMNNVHDDQPVVFHTRWVLSYLRGPLTRQQISTLMAERKTLPILEKEKKAISPQAEQMTLEDLTPVKQARDVQPTPVLPAGVDVYYVPPDKGATGGKLVYRPALLGRGKLHFSRVLYKVDTWEQRTLLQPIHSELDDEPWQEIETVHGRDVTLDKSGNETFVYSELPAVMSNAKKYSEWKKKLAAHFYTTQVLNVWKCTELKKYSHPDESEGDFRIRLSHEAKEVRELKIEKLRKKYASKMATIQGRINTANAAVTRETGQANRATFDSAISFGSTILGALFGRKLTSVTNVSKAGTSMRSAGRAAQQRGDVTRAKAKVKELEEQVAKLEEDLATEIEALQDTYSVESFEFETLKVRPNKTDMDLDDVAVAWTPWQVDPAGIAEPLFDLDS